MSLLRHPGPWFGAFATWFGVLWWLSSGIPTVPEVLSFRASDKLMHFGYFFGGAGLLSASLFTAAPGLADGRRIVVTAVVVGLVGALDEFHQSFVPGRQGNDPADLAADVLGAIAGAFAFQPFRQMFRSAGRP